MSDKTNNLLRSIILVSEKAANIARAIRQEKHLLSLLIREKKEDEKNPRFAQDFKTLADVLVQEVVKHDLGSEFPNLVDHIYGEESNEFSCLDGVSLHLTVGNSVGDTSSQLMRILGDDKAADSLAQLVHSTTELNIEVPPCNIPTDQLGIWIDPIDSTAEYISGGAVESKTEGVFSSGLPCVTVLIGAFHKESGEPVLGVVNQPFNRLQGERWEGQVFWGINYGDLKLSSMQFSESSERSKVVVISSSESEEIKSRLSAGGFSLLEVAGAGYKLLCVATHAAAAYVLSKPSTFFWDTCAVQAVLSAQGGGIVSFKNTLKGESALLCYRAGTGPAECCNDEGLIAYNDQLVLQNIVKMLSE